MAYQIFNYKYVVYMVKKTNWKLLYKCSILFSIFQQLFINIMFSNETIHLIKIVIWTALSRFTWKSIEDSKMNIFILGRFIKNSKEDIIVRLLAFYSNLLILSLIASEAYVLKRHCSVHFLCRTSNSCL